MRKRAARRWAARFVLANMGATNGGCRNAFKKSVVEGNPRDVIGLGNVHVKLLGSYI